MNHLTIPDFPGMPPALCRAIGEHFRHIAAKLEAQAAIDEADARDTARRRIARQAAQAGARTVEHLVAAGQEPDAAIAAVADKHCLDRAQLATIWSIEQKKPGARIRLRNRKVMLLAARGWTDEQIAGRYKMHRKSVNRIVRRMLRENPPTLPEPCGAR